MDFTFEQWKELILAVVIAVVGLWLKRDTNTIREQNARQTFQNEELKQQLVAHEQNANIRAALRGEPSLPPLEDQ